MVGFDAKNKCILDPRFICPICALILRDPIQLSTCGHRQCQSCFDNDSRTTIICTQCQTETQRTQVLLDRSFKNDMQSIPIDCHFCQWTDVLNNYQEHLDQCHPQPKCGYCAQQFNSVNELNQHKILECQKLAVYCILKDFGCNDPIMRGKIGEHYLAEQHQNTILEVVRQIRSQSFSSQMDTDLSRTTTATSIDPAKTRLKKILEALNILTGGVETLKNNMHRLTNEISQFKIKLQTLSDVLPLKMGMQESNSSLGERILNQSNTNQNSLTMNEKTDNNLSISYDGTLVWKIPNFQGKMADAQSERQTSIYSPPFYSSPTGYKMRARLYLYGDGNARRTHISLFFVLMRSEYDAILQFPFNFKVTFCLYDQSGTQRHIIDSFRPDVKSNSFQRPTSEMNIASGIPKFFPLAMIQQEGDPYVRDDTMFIKVMVDFGDMPKTLLPYAVSLYSGLPTHIQQAMIKEEEKRRAQQKL